MRPPGGQRETWSSLQTMRTMTRVTLLLLPLLALVAVSEGHQSYEPLDYEQEIRDFLEKFRLAMRAPQPDLGLPTLDPLHVEHVDLDVNSDFIQVNGTLDAVDVVDLSTFVTLNASFELVGFQLFVAVGLDSVTATGLYDVTGNLEGGAIHFFGAGPFSVELRNASLSALVKLRSNDSVPYIDELILDYAVPVIQTNLTGLLGGGDVGDVMNDVISDMAPGLLEDNKATLLGKVTPLLVDLANQKLSNYTMSDLLCLVAGVGC